MRAKKLREPQSSHFTFYYDTPIRSTSSRSNGRLVVHENPTTNKGKTKHPAVYINLKMKVDKILI